MPEGEIVSVEPAIEKVCQMIESGKQVIQVAEDMGVDYGDLWRWIEADPERHKLVSASIELSSRMSKEKIYRRLGQIAFADIRGLYKENGELKPVSEWPADVAACVQAIEIEEFGRDGKARRVKITDPLKAIEMLGKQLGMFKEKVEHTASDDLATLIEKSFKGAGNENSNNAGGPAGNGSLPNHDETNGGKDSGSSEARK